MRSMLAGRLNQGDCELSMMDSSTSAEWLRKTNFREIIGNNTELIQSQVRVKTAQHHATLFLKASIKEYSQWFPASKSFSNSTTAQQNQLVADCIAAETFPARAVTGSTHENHAWSWHRFTKYLGSIGLSHEVFLYSFTRGQ